MHDSRPVFTDSHLHFDTFHEAGEVEGLLERADVAGVARLVAIGGSAAANRLAADLAAAHPGRIRAAVGFDRDEATEAWDEVELRTLCGAPGVCAIGETGLDYHYSADSAEAQRALFSSMLALGRAFAYPTVIHSREADGDTLRMLEEHRRAWTGREDGVGVLHCFTGGERFARALIELGLFISFSGILTFKTAEALRTVAKALPEDCLLIETDAPYLAPIPYRGKRNEPAYVVEVAAALAEIRGKTPNYIAGLTTANADRLFAWPLSG